MKQSVIIFFAALLLLISPACERVIEPKDLPQQDPQLVVNCIMLSDETIDANITLSRSILSSKPYKNIDNAVCEVYENGSYIGKLSSMGSGNYTSTIIPQAKKTYELKISASGYEGVSASTSIPETVTITAVQRYDTANAKIQVSDYGGGSSSKYISGALNFKFKIIDKPGEKNFYSITPVISFEDTINGNEIFSNATIYLNNGNDDSYSGGNSLEITDETLVNGNEIFVDVTISAWKEVDSTFQLGKIEVVLLLGCASPEYYKYMVTLKDQAYTGASFFAEPAQVYSNVSNGMGIVAGVSQAFIRIYP